MRAAHWEAKFDGHPISVDSTPGEGSTFRVRLPLADEVAGSTAAAPVVPALPSVRAGCGERLLCIDDDKVMSTVASALLQQ